MSIGVINH